MSSKYTILVEADLDQNESVKNITESLKKIAPQIGFTIKSFAIDPAALKILKSQVENALKSINVGVVASVSGGNGGSGGGGGGSGGGRSGGRGGGRNIVGPVPAGYGGRVPFDINQRISDIRAEAMGGTVDATIVEGINGITYATLRWKNATDAVITEIYNLNKDTEQLEKTTSRFSDSENTRMKTAEANYKKQTRSIEIIANSYKKVEDIQNRIANSRINQPTGSTVAQPSQIDALKRAASDYQRLIDDVRTRTAARGGIVSNEDNRRIKEAERNIRRLNDELKAEESRLKMSSDAMEEHAVRTKRNNEEIQKTVLSAQKLVSATNVKTSNEDQRATEVQNAIAANQRLQNSVDLVNGKIARNEVIVESDLEAIRNNSAEVQRATLALNEYQKANQIANQNISARLKSEKELDNILAKANKTMQSTKDLTLNKAQNNQYIREATIAYQDLGRAIDDIAKKRASGQSVTATDIQNLEAFRVKAEGAGDAVQKQGKALNSWGHEIGIAIKRTIEWAGAMTLLYGSLRQIQAGIGFIKELNKELIAIQVVTGYTKEQMVGLSQTFNDLAKNTGATTKEVAAGSAEWFRQGKTIEETSELMRATMVLSKLGNMESAQATEYLTSMLNGFKLEAKDTMGVLDKVIQLDNTLATSSAEVAEALSRSSNSAQQMGVTFDELASYVAVTSSVTRRSAESIGEAFNLWRRCGIKNKPQMKIISN